MYLITQPKLRCLYTALPHLTLSQLEDLFEDLTDQRRCVLAYFEIEAAAREMRCSSCGCASQHKHGKTRTGIQRQRCTGCGVNFTGRSGTLDLLRKSGEHQLNGQEVLNVPWKRTDGGISA